MPLLGPNILLPHLPDQLFWSSIFQTIFLKILVPLKMLVGVMWRGRGATNEVRWRGTAVSLGIPDVVHQAIKLGIRSFSRGEFLGFPKPLLIVITASTQPGTMRLHVCTTSP